MAASANITNKVEVQIRCTDQIACAVSPQFAKDHFLKITNVQAALETGIDVPANSISMCKLIFALQLFDNPENKKGELDDDGELGVLANQMDDYSKLYRDKKNPNPEVEAINNFVKAIEYLGINLMAKGAAIWLSLGSTIRHFRAVERLADLHEWQKRVSIIKKEYEDED